MTNTPTKQILAEMLTERVGISILDSGGQARYDEHGHYIDSINGYGRSFERNQGRDFETEHAIALTFEYGYIEVTHNIYHWLAERLEFCPGLDRLFHEVYVPLVDEGENQSWFELLQQFPAWLQETDPSSLDLGYEKTEEFFGYEPHGIYGEGEPVNINTYNSKNLLSQIMRYLYFTIDGTAYVGLMIHGGCDVRGGYTKPRFFWADNGCYGTEAIFDNAQADISCHNDHSWNTDDGGYHWHANFGDCQEWTETDTEYNKRMNAERAARELATTLNLAADAIEDGTITATQAQETLGEWGFYIDHAIRFGNGVTVPEYLRDAAERELADCKGPDRLLKSSYTSGENLEKYKILDDDAHQERLARWTEADTARPYREAIKAGQELMDGVEEPAGEPKYPWGYIWVDEDGHGHCPICGEQLEAY